MTGLDKIISEIALEAKRTADNIISEANTNADRIRAKATAHANDIESAASVKAEAEYKHILTRAESTGEVASSRAVLLEKQHIIKDIINKAANEIDGMKDEEYFALLTSLLNKYVENSQGEIILSEKDKKRITKSFKKVITDNRLTISDKNGDFNNGFILVYGDIEENCTIEALIEDERDRLHDAVSNYLF